MNEVKKAFTEAMSNSKVHLSDLVAHWSVPLSDGIHKIEFEHGTTSGKRVIYVDGKVSMHYVEACSRRR